MRNFGATYVDSARKLTWGFERVIYVLRPLLSDSKLKKIGLEDIVKKGDEWAEDAHKTGPLEVYNTYHSILINEITKLSGKDILLTTALSVDLTEPDPSKDVFPTRSCLDPAAYNNRLTDEQMIAEMQINEECTENDGDWHNCFENLIKIPVGPFIMPYETKYDENKNPFIQHALPNIVELTNEKMESKGKKGLGTLVKKLGDNSPQVGTYNFSELLFLPGKANHAFQHYDNDFIRHSKNLLPNAVKEEIDKKFDLENMGYAKPPEELVRIFNPYYCSVIKQSTLINRKIVALALEEVLKLLGIKTLIVYASETSYVNSILHYLDGDYKKPRIKVMENVDRSPYGECDKSAMNRYKGLLMEYFAN